MYFSHTFIEPTEGNTAKTYMSVYSMNINSDDIKEIYNRKDINFEFSLKAILNDKLIFQKTHFMNSPGPCSNPWVYAYENFMKKIDNPNYYIGLESLDLKNLNNGFSHFLVPKDKYDSEVLSQKSCEENLGVNR